MDTRIGRVETGVRSAVPLALSLVLGVLSVLGTSVVLQTSAVPGPLPLTTAPPASATAADGPALSSGTGPTGLGLSIAITPSAICVSTNPACPSSERTARVTLGASTPAELFISYPAVQVVFLVETTPYDGVYDGSDGIPGTEACADSSLAQPCEESNGVPFFVAHAGAIAGAIASANPRSQVSFGLVDYFSTGDLYDDQQEDIDEGNPSYSYHVDVGDFVAASQFQSAVAGTFQQSILAGGYVMPDSDFSDNVLHSDSITALYGAIMGYGVDWDPDAHHVLVLITSTAPRDPSYLQNYCVSPNENWRVACYGGIGPYDSGCEPAYDFGSGTSPDCVGWIYSQTGDPNASISALARSAPNCRGSLGHRCTIDVIDLWTTPTDPYSDGWPSATAGGPGGTFPIQNSERVLEAGCDLAAATNGSWDGPDYFACPNGVVGQLGFVAHGPAQTPNLNNPSLFAAFQGVSFGPTVSDDVAYGGNASMFHFVPFANVRPAPVLQASTTCLTPTGPKTTCPGPTETNHSGGVSLDWNWSDRPVDNVLTTGDSWTASFDVIADGPPYGFVPVDACTTAKCAADGSGSVAAGFTSARYLAPPTNESVAQSFGPALVRITYGPLLGIPSTPVVPPSGTPPPVFVPPTFPTSPGLAALSVSPSVPTISVQALGAGLLGAGFTRVAQKNRPVAVGQANLTAPRGPKRRGPPPRPVGRFV